MIEDQREFQQTYYDRHYPKRVAAVHEQLRHPLFRSVADLPLGEAGLRIFEVGCGEGFFGSAIKRTAEPRGLHIAYSGADLSQAALELARPTLGDDLTVGDATEVMAGLPAASRDLVIVKNLLHHLDDPASLLREASRVVGPDGRVAVIEARLGCPQFWIFSGFAPRRERYFFYGARRNRAALKAAGFELVHQQRFSVLPYELLFHIRFGIFRNLLSTDDPKFIAKVSGVDDKLTATVPWITSYVIWIARPVRPATPRGQNGQGETSLERA
jgi:ubiquinone/menaquinone biosynthesis C-methylase UbiE